jgi:hypothetical protein
MNVKKVYRVVMEEHPKVQLNETTLIKLTAIKKKICITC